MTEVRRPGKEWRERVLAALFSTLTAPLAGTIAAAIKLEGLLDREARGPVLFIEQRVSRGQTIDMMKFRTLKQRALDSLADGPTHIKELESDEHLTRVGRRLKDWYLDELPQLWNIVKGDMFLIGTRPYPIEPYHEELQRGITRKRDMPAGLIGPVQARKGSGRSDLETDREYWDLFQHASAWDLLKFDVRVVLDSLRTQLRHEGL